MKTTRTYPQLCGTCNGNGFIQPIQGQITTSAWLNPCPVCNGAKTIQVTEITEDDTERTKDMYEKGNLKEKLVEFSIMLNVSRTKEPVRNEEIDEFLDELEN